MNIWLTAEENERQDEIRFEEDKRELLAQAQQAQQAQDEPESHLEMCYRTRWSTARWTP